MSLIMIHTSLKLIITSSLPVLVCSRLCQCILRDILASLSQPESSDHRAIVENRSKGQEKLERELTNA